MKMSCVLAWVVAGLAALSPYAAFAQVSCSFTTSIDFGTLDPSAASPTQVIGTGTYKCVIGASPYVLSCANLGSPTPTRYMTGPNSAQLRFELYSDASRTTK